MQQMIATTATTRNQNDDARVAMTSMTKELLHSCQLLVACTIALYTNDDDNDDDADTTTTTNLIGASKSLCQHTKTAIHQIIHAVVQLVSLLLLLPTPPSTSRTTSSGGTNIHPAQQTGVIWEACQTILTDRMSTTTVGMEAIRGHQTVM
jgi:hypothetical protein